ncbi:MAG: phage tail protein [Marinobacter sp.]|nr:phage tail protein [Marinobacter sp.]MBP55385.1 phage tail protein [Marinobacter sp.]|tara:strand:- start:1486 stop:1836 length:351 start_codon:yes stop_codon:yes gene_type:complete
MDLTLDALKDMGAFTGAPVEKEIVLKKDGNEEKTATVYVRKLSYYSAVSDIKSLNAKSDAVAGRIASAICDKEGKQVFAPGDITGEADPDRGPLNSEITMELLRVIGEVNGKKTKS